MSDVSSWVHVFHDGAGDTPVVLTFHGTGADEHDPIQLGQALVPGTWYPVPGTRCPRALAEGSGFRAGDESLVCQKSRGRL